MTTSAPAFACMAGMALLFVVVALGRAALGPAQAEASRYVYLAFALALPVIGLVLSDLAARGRTAQMVVAALVGLLVTYNVVLLGDRAADEAARERRIRRTVLAGADMAVRGEPFLAFAPDPTFDPDVTTGILRRMAEDGKLPPGDFGPGDRLVAASWLQLVFGDAPIPDVVPPRLGPVVAATVTVTEAPAPGLAAGCVVVTPEGPRPVLVLEPAGRMSVTVRSSAGGQLGATLRDVGPPPLAGEGRSVTLEPGKAVNVNVVADVDQVVLAVPAAGTTEVCGL